MAENKHVPDENGDPRQGDPHEGETHEEDEDDSTPEQLLKQARTLRRVWKGSVTRHLGICERFMLDENREAVSLKFRELKTV